LIGFYFYKEEAKAAAKKAFIMTRIGDVGLFIGMLLLFWQAGSFEYDQIFASVADGKVPLDQITLISLLIFIGAIGKSGQFPLHSWLPDAMEGPTPVSALIHAATMVAAGVYLVALMYPLFAASETALLVVATIGAFTAIFAASIGLVQKDIKRVLAYSTVSQLGYMMLALGSAGYVAGVFHLMTHAFFKALLFLAAGSVIHAVHTQNIDEMGGLWKKLKFTGPLFLIGTLAISGVPLFSGFFSKDEILIAAWTHGNLSRFYRTSENRAFKCKRIPAQYADSNEYPCPARHFLRLQQHSLVRHISWRLADRRFAAAWARTH
jgi:NADH-quinone oxidoreductase subunit L